MGGWKSKLQVQDLGDEDRLEMQCRRCGKIRYLTKASLLERDAGHHYLDHIECKAQCRVFGCKGKMRMALIRQHKVSAFIGGMA